MTRKRCILTTRNLLDVIQELISNRLLALVVTLDMDIKSGVFLTLDKQPKLP